MVDMERKVGKKISFARRTWHNFKSPDNYYMEESDTIGQAAVCFVW